MERFVVIEENLLAKVKLYEDDVSTEIPIVYGQASSDFWREY